MVKILVFLKFNYSYENKYLKYVCVCACKSKFWRGRLKFRGLFFYWDEWGQESGNCTAIVFKQKQVEKSKK